MEVYIIYYMLLSSFLFSPHCVIRYFMETLGHSSRTGKLLEKFSLHVVVPPKSVLIFKLQTIEVPL